MPDTREVLTPPPNPHHIEADKRFVFNETGNIMISTTATTSDQIEQSVRDVFAEVAVFYASMTKAVTTTVNPYAAPVKGRPQYYSLYNLDALQAVIDGSGCFIQVTEEDVTHKATSWGADFSKDLIQAVLGLATGAGELSFAAALASSIGKEGVNISGQSASDTNRVAHIVFVCEYLMGMPFVTAIVISADATETSQVFNAGPCFREQSKTITLSMHKDTYMFVTPNFIKQYAGDLNSGMNDPAYLALINMLQRLVARLPTINGVYDLTDTTKPVRVDTGELKSGTAYAFYGEYLGSTPGTVTVEGDSGVTIAMSTWSDTGVAFTVTYSGNDPSKQVTIKALLNDGPGKGQTLSLPGAYAVKKAGA